MENYFLVRANQNYHAITKGGVYLASLRKRSDEFYWILDDSGRRNVYWSKRLDKIEFIDIWELKRKNEWLTNQS